MPVISRVSIHPAYRAATPFKQFHQKYLTLLVSVLTFPQLNCTGEAMLRKIIILVAAGGLLLSFAGCAGKQIQLLEEQVTELEQEKAALQDENAALAGSLTSAQNDYQALEGELQTKNDIIDQQEKALNELRFRNLELSASLEESQEQEQEQEQVEVKSVVLSGDFETDYNHTMDLYKKKWYAQAAGIFKSLVQSDMQHSLSDNAQYWLGECYYAQKQYENAIPEFEKVFAFPNTNKADAAQLKIGLCWYKLRKYAEAREQLIRLLSAYPSSEYIGRARAILDAIP